MSASIAFPAVIVVGASGNLGPFIVQELLKQKVKFSRIGILSTPEKRAKFHTAAKYGVDIVLGNYRDAKCYEGAYNIFLLLPLLKMTNSSKDLTS